MLTVALAIMLGSSEEQAGAAFRRGRELLAAGRTAEACAAFEESHRLDPALGALLNLAECTALLNDRPRAFTLFSEVLAWATRKSDQPRIAVARERVAMLRSQLGLAVVDAPVDMKVVVDRVPVATGQVIPLEPGAHVVELTAADGRTETRSFSVAPGQTLTISGVRSPGDRPPSERPLLPSPRPGRSAPTTVPEAPHPSVASPKSSAGPIWVLAAGAALTIAGVALSAWSVDIWNQGEAQRLGGPLTVTQRTYETAGSLYPVGLGALIAGPLTVAGGVLWLILSR